MSKKFICLVSFALVLGFVVTNAANADPGLVGWWKFDEDSGTTASDSSGNGNDGTLIDSVQWAAGQIGGALQFDGSPGYVQIPHSDELKLVNQGDFTCTMWFKMDVVTFGNLLQQTDVNGTGRTWLFVHSSEEIRAYLGGAATGSGVNAEAGIWYHIAVVVTEAGATDTVDLYVNGEPAGTPGQLGMEDCEGDYLIGTDKALASRWLTGLVDDLRLYNHALSEVEILGAMQGSGEVWPYALAPDPADGAMLEATWANLSWRPGGHTISHDVYIGDNFDDVNDGAESAFVGNQAVTTLIVGFLGFAFPEGLVPGTTYYWRIDEVNDTEPNSPWKGDIWSFFIPPRTAYDPKPPDGVKFVVLDAELGWTAGFNAKLHYVFFGDNFDDVNNAIVGLPQATTTYTPGTLELEKDYYWRIDEFDGVATNKGDVWSFKTIPDIPITNPNMICWWTLDEGVGTTVVDWSGHNNHGTLNGNSQWVYGYDSGALEFYGSGDFVETTDYQGITGTDPRTCCAWIKTTTANRANQNIMSWGQNVAGQKWRMRIDDTGGLRAEVNGGYHYGVTNIADGNWHHVAVTFEDDGTPDALDLVLYVDGQMDATADSLDEPINTAEGPVRIGESPWHNAPFTGVIDDARIYDKVLTQDEIQLVMRIDPLLAWEPSPKNGSTPEIGNATPLTWSTGDNASQHDVYFGMDRDDVVDANASDTTGIYRGRQGFTFYTPPEVEWGGGPYYWRVDEYNTDTTISKGNLWSFTVADSIGIEDFEDYNDYPPDEIFSTWIDGWEVPTNGSLAGHADPPFAETGNVHGGSQSMPLYYENNFKYSEATMTLVWPRDWTEEGVGVLSLWFCGDASNAAEPMYVALNGSAVVYHDNPDAALIDTWTEWTIDLQEFAAQGVNLANVNTISIGFGDKNNLQAGGSGMVLFDDIRLYRPAPEPEPAP